MRAAVLLIILTLFTGLCGCAPPGERSTLDLPMSGFPRSTPAERNSALTRARAAWDLRPRETSEHDRKAEKMFMNRFASLARKMAGTESAKPAGQLWRKFLDDHLRRYPD